MHGRLDGLSMRWEVPVWMLQERLLLVFWRGHIILSLIWTLDVGVLGGLLLTKLGLQVCIEPVVLWWPFCWWPWLLVPMLLSFFSPYSPQPCCLSHDILMDAVWVPVPEGFDWVISQWCCSFSCYELQWLLQACHRVACRRAREPPKERSKCIWPPGLVELSRLGVGKILFRLMTHPSSSYPR